MNIHWQIQTTEYCTNVWWFFLLKLVGNLIAANYLYSGEYFNIILRVSKDLICNSLSSESLLSDAWHDKGQLGPTKHNWLFNYLIILHWNNSSLIWVSLVFHKTTVKFFIDFALPGFSFHSTTCDFGILNWSFPMLITHWIKLVHYNCT
jgi:hypothetical protein